MLSVMNRSVVMIWFIMNVVCYEQVCFEKNYRKKTHIENRLYIPFCSKIWSCLLCFNYGVCSAMIINLRKMQTMQPSQQHVGRIGSSSPLENLSRPPPSLRNQTPTSTRTLQTFLSDGLIFISNYTEVRGPDILRNVIVSGYITFYQNNKFFLMY